MENGQRNFFFLSFSVAVFRYIRSTILFRSPWHLQRGAPLTIILISGLIWFDLCLFRYSSRLLCFEFSLLPLANASSSFHGAHFRLYFILYYFLGKFAVLSMMPTQRYRSILPLPLENRCRTESQPNSFSSLYFLLWWTLLLGVIIVISLSWSTILTFRITFSGFFPFHRIVITSISLSLLPLPYLLISLGSIFRSFNVIIFIDSNRHKCICWLFYMTSGHTTATHAAQTTKSSTFTSYFLWSISVWRQQ